MKILSIIIVVILSAVTNTFGSSSSAPMHCFAIYSLAATQGPTEKREFYKNEAIFFGKIASPFLKTKEGWDEQVEKSTKSLQSNLNSRTDVEKIEYMRNAGAQCRELKIEAIKLQSSKIKNHKK